MTGMDVTLAGLALGLAAGVLSGMFGIGGGLVIVPALMLIFKMPAKMAVGTSLFALMWPVGLLGVIEYWKKGQMRATEGVWIALGLFVGAYFGAKITLPISQSSMKRLYAVFLLVVGFYYLVTTREPAPRDPAPAAGSPAAAGEGPTQVH